ncbi:phenylacetic acid degradation protein PaaN [Allonocardiopsis opalescens]|uniref:Phenylacetic acid degradation protein paaN n=1 Tax=Allonocardiopsis opalescens TaxID=1144618 RepID=A0A2T0QCU6_9ACTN|nr:phenylacetic acid degradation protein PaaN [Allonocardiopsis opalescens]PRY01673.1 phenylacetic acid degradation protein paaN [Allonocardiopsis opalescens]
MGEPSSTPGGRPDFHAVHRELLERAVAAVRERAYFSAYPESPSPRVYGETAAAEGKAAFERLLGGPFPLDQPGERGRVATERSPYGIELGVSYPRADPDALIAAATAALPGWRDAGPDTRAGIAVEILRRINARSFELAHAVQHTTGQSFVMAFQAGGPHAQDRGLEAAAYAYEAQTRYAASVRWEKPQRKGEPLVMEKSFTPVPRGVALVIGCTTFPTWNAYPAIFADLVTGNPVIVKPHPGAVLPLALTVSIAREVLAEAGMDPNAVLLAAEEHGERLAAELALRPEVRVVDFTGSTEFGDWLERSAVQAFVSTEKSGVNTVVVDSTDDYRGLLGNLAFSLALYSGQMCTTPQNIYVPREGVATDDGRRGPGEFAADLAAALDRLLADPAKAAGTLGALANQGVVDRLDGAAALGKVVLASRALAHPEFPDAVVRTPTVVALDADASEVYGREHFGPISFVITTDDTAHALRLLRETVAERGALTASVYSTDPEVLAAARSAALDAGVNLSENLTGPVFVNQSAAFSDYHGSGANPAATAALTDPGFVAGRFTFVQVRRHA